jgi:hypothetical protein
MIRMPSQPSPDAAPRRSPIGVVNRIRATLPVEPFQRADASPDRFANTADRGPGLSPAEPSRLRRVRDGSGGIRAKARESRRCGLPLVVRKEAIEG